MEDSTSTRPSLSPPGSPSQIADFLISGISTPTSRPAAPGTPSTPTSQRTEIIPPSDSPLFLPASWYVRNWTSSNLLQQVPERTTSRFAVNNGSPTVTRTTPGGGSGRRNRHQPHYWTASRYVAHCDCKNCLLDLSIEIAERLQYLLARPESERPLGLCNRFRNQHLL